MRGEGEALFWVGVFHQVVHDDPTMALSALTRSYELVAAAGDDLTLSYAARHLGFADAAAGRAGVARERLEESVRLRRGLGFLPGVAAGVLALAELAARGGNKDEAATLAEEARSIAESCGADGVLRWVEHFRDEWL